MNHNEIIQLIKKMTLEEKASLCSGADFWHTEKIDRLGIPSSMVSDGPHGLRKQNDKADHLGVNESIKAVCFPAGCATAASFNRDLLNEIGETLGNECQAEGVSVLLGPAVNIKRSPLCGRNFEYYSEDPYVASEIAGAFIDGVQSKNVGTSIKHFFANNQEHRRMTSSSNVDERTLHEIYLAAFEGAITKHKPWTVMCSYNRLNGVHLAENKKYLTDVLRNEWGFDGYVMSDWGAVNNRIEGLKAGLDLEMPSSFGINDAEIVKAVKEGKLKEEILDQAVQRILNIVYRYEENRDEKASWNIKEDHEKAKQAARETVVLLKNDGILPIEKEKSVAFIGKFAESPRYQGGGSSHINSEYVTSAIKYIKGNENVHYAKGYEIIEDKTDMALLDEAIELAKKSDVAVIFAGLPDQFESEGFDRTHLRMPDCQSRLIEEVTKVQPNTIIVLHNGAPVEMPWISKVKGVLEAYLGGEAIGGAVVDILYGDVNPSAKLPETFPLKLEDNPSYLSYFGEMDEVDYQEGIFVGYRYYDKKKMDVLFPFGYGLSYTTFEYSNLILDKKEMKDTDTLKVSIDITNTGKVAGKEVVQLYVSDVESTVIRPDKELRDFTKVFLNPGETKTVTFQLGKRAFAYYNTQIHDWHVESGMFAIMIGKSSRDIVETKQVNVTSTQKLPVTYSLDTTCGDIMNDKKAWDMVAPFMQIDALKIDEEKEAAASEAISKEMMEAMIRYMPLRGTLSFGSGKYTQRDLENLVFKLNNIER